MNMFSAQINEVNLDPTGFGEMMLSHAERTIASGEIASFQSVIPQIQWLQDQANSMKILFRFIMWENWMETWSFKFLERSAELLLEHAIDSDSGEVLVRLFSS